LGVEVADYEFVFKIKKFKMADSIWWRKFKYVDRFDYKCLIKDFRDYADYEYDV